MVQVNFDITDFEMEKVKEKFNLLIFPKSLTTIEQNIKNFFNRIEENNFIKLIEQSNSISLE